MRTLLVFNQIYFPQSPKILFCLLVLLYFFSKPSSSWEVSWTSEKLEEQWKKVVSFPLLKHLKISIDILICKRSKQSWGEQKNTEEAHLLLKSQSLSVHMTLSHILLVRIYYMASHTWETDSHLCFKSLIFRVVFLH